MEKIIPSPLGLANRFVYVYVCVYMLVSSYYLCFKGGIINCRQETTQKCVHFK